MSFSTDTENFLKFVWKFNGSQIDKSTLNKNIKAESIMLSDFKINYKAIAIKAAWSWHKKRYLDLGSESQSRTTHSVDFS